MGDQYVDMRAILDVLRRRAPLILGVLVVGLALSSLVVFSLKPAYTASALVMVDPTRKDLLDPNGIQGAAGSGDSARIDSEVEIANSTPVLLRAIDDAKLMEEPHLAPMPGLRARLLALLRIAEPAMPTGQAARNAVLRNLDATVSARRRGFTYLIAISAEASTPDGAARIANAVAEAYIRVQVQSKVQSVMDALDMLVPRLAEASAALAASESALDLMVGGNLDRLVAESDRQDIAKLQQELDAVLSERARMGAALEALERGSGEGMGQTSPADIREDAAALLRVELAANRSLAAQLRDDMRSAMLDGALPPEVLTDIYEMQQAAALARTNYERLIGRVNDLRAQADLQVADSRVAAAATPPERASFPNVRMMLFVAGVALLGIGAALAFIVENFIGGFTSEAQLEAVTRRKVASVIPQQKPAKRADGAPANSAADSVVAAPLSPFAESLRRLRLRVDQGLARGVGSGRGMVLVVTSSVPFEGKTTTAIGLARVYAASGLKVLLVDGDMRRPAVHQQLDIRPSGGLFDYLAGNSKDAVPVSMLSQDPLSEAAVLVGTRHGEAGSEQLLTSTAFLRLVSAARETFDVIIIDTPPVGVVVDGIYLLDMADAVLFVVRWGSTAQQDTVRALDAVESAKRADVPVVLAINQQKLARRRYRGGYYGPETG